MIVYKVTNIVNNKVYIGQTAYSLDTRKAKHESMCNITGYYFHNAIKKYDKSKFIWEVLVTCHNKNEMSAFEMYYIKKFRSNNRRFGYNMTLGGESPLGRKHTKESKRKMSESSKGISILRTKEWNKKIGDAQRGNKNHMYGKTGKLHHGSKRYIVTLPNNKEVEVLCLAEFCRKKRLCVKNLNACANGKRKTHKGYKCRHYDALEGEI